jgi:RHS repeat-associated protein
MARQTKVRITIPSVIARVHNYQPFNRLTNTATTSYVYNANGNMVSKTVGANTTQFYWDYENRLKQVILPSGQSVVYKYDALGRRIERNVNNSTTWTKFTYDGEDVILDQNSDGTSVTYLNGAGIDNKLRQTVNGQAQYFLSDHLGSTNALTDATGTVISSTSYDSFGNASNASFPTRYQFTGREFDNFTGLQYSRARFYDANLGRFISEDPIGFRGGDINIYGYVKNRPLRRKDPKGLDDGDMNPNPFNNNAPPFDWDAHLNQLQNQSNDYWKYQMSLPEKPECGPAGHPLLEWAVPDNVGGTLGPFSSKYNVTPPCEAHDTCYSTCGKTKGTCDVQLGVDVSDSCQRQGATHGAGSFYGSGYYWGVRLLGDGAYESAQKQSGCQLFTPDPCSKYGSWVCK